MPLIYSCVKLDGADNVLGEGADVNAYDESGVSLQHCTLDTHGLATSLRA